MRHAYSPVVTMFILFAGACGGPEPSDSPVPDWAVGSWHLVEAGSSGPRIRQLDISADGEVSTRYFSCGGLDESEVFQAVGASDGSVRIDVAGGVWFGTGLLSEVVVEETNLCDAARGKALTEDGTEIESQIYGAGDKCLDLALCPDESAADWCEAAPPSCS